jgi:hypothetical protein
MTNKDEQANNAGQNGESEFERFERLTKALVSVPKSEIDAKEKARKKRRRPAAPKA